MHAVEDAQERRLAAARRTDERGDLAGGHVERHTVEYLVRAEPRRDVARMYAGEGGGRGEQRRIRCILIPVAHAEPALGGNPGGDNSCRTDRGHRVGLGITGKRRLEQISGIERRGLWRRHDHWHEHRGGRC